MFDRSDTLSTSARPIVWQTGKRFRQLWVSTFFGPRYIGDDIFGAEWVEFISPIEIRIHHFLSGKNNNTLYKIDTCQTVYWMFLLFCTVKQLYNISNLRLLKYFIQKINGKRDISQQVVTLSKFGNARICECNYKTS